MRTLLCGIVIGLTSCASTIPAESPPVPQVEPPKQEVKKLPAALLRPCLYEEMDLLTIQELSRVYKVARASVIECGRDKKKAIEELRKDGYK